MIVEYSEISLKLKPEESKIWKRKAKELGISVTQFLRECVNLYDSNAGKLAPSIVAEKSDRNAEDISAMKKDIGTINNNEELMWDGIQKIEKLLRELNDKLSKKLT